jgi:hypothetical protein
MTVSELYEPMLLRDIAAIPASARAFGREHGSETLFQAVSKFALLAASPSQHGKHAVLATVAAREIEDELGTRYQELLAECAIYAAQVRLPWSEPPIPDPPAIEADHPNSLEEIRAAIHEKDRLRGEKWLAARLRGTNIARDFFTIAAEDLSDFGHKLMVAVAVWKLAELHRQPRSFAFLRVAVAEWTSYSEPVDRRPLSGPEDRSAKLHALVNRLIAEQGSPEAFHGLALYDAGMEASRLAGDGGIEHRVAMSLQTAPVVRSSPPDAGALEPPIYRLARDYAEYLKSFAISRRIRQWVDPSAIRAAAKYNRDHSSSFEEWSFA